MLEFSLSLDVLSEFRLSTTSSPSRGFNQEHSSQALDTIRSPPGNEPSTSRPTSPNSLTPPQALLFQRTVALSDGLKKLNGGASRDSAHSQSRLRGLAIGGEPEEVRSLSPHPEQHAPAISRRLAHRMETGIQPIEPVNQENDEIASNHSGSGDLIMLDGQARSLIASQHEKHCLSPLDQEDFTPKRYRFSVSESPVGCIRQLPRDVSHGSAHQMLFTPEVEPTLPATESTRKHLDILRADLKQSEDDSEHRKHQIDVNNMVPSTSCQTPGINRIEHDLEGQMARQGKAAQTISESKHQILLPTILRAQSLPLGMQDHGGSFEALAPPSGITARHLQKLRKQLLALENYLQDNIAQLDDNTINDKIQNLENLRTDFERFQGVYEAQREIEERQGVSNSLHPQVRSATFDVLTGQGESTLMEGMEPRKPSKTHLHCDSISGR